MNNNFSYKYQQILVNQNPDEFFKFCLEHKLYKDGNKEDGDLYYQSHMKKIYEKKQRFTGIESIIAYDNDIPIGICLIRKHTDDKDYNYNLSNVDDKRKFIFDKTITDGFNINNQFLIKQQIEQYNDNRIRKNSEKKRFEDYYIHLGFAMFYVHPDYRGKKIAQSMLNEMEKNIQHNFKNSLKDFPEFFLNKLNTSFFTITCREKAQEVLKNSSYLFHTTCSNEDLNFKHFISAMTQMNQYDLEYQKGIYSNYTKKLREGHIIDFLAHNYNKTISLKNNLDTFNQNNYDTRKKRITI